MSWWESDPVADGQTAGGRTRITVYPQGAEPTPDYGRAISAVESGGNYSALGPQTRTGDRAYGKYQIMGANIGPWTQEVLGQELKPHEFLTNPQAQDAVFQAKFGNYVSKYGPEGAARAWFAGEGGMNDPNRRDILGTSVADYGRKFTNALGPGGQPSRPVAGGFAPDSAATPTDMSAQSRKPAGGEWWSADPVAAPPEQGPPMPPTPDIGQGKSFGLGAIQGATANFGDELRGVQNAAGLPNWVPGGVDTVAGLARLGYEYLTGGDEAGTKYREGRDQFRQLMATAKEHYPNTALTGEIAGGLAAPGGAALKGASGLARAGRSALVGAGYGAASGAGGGETLPERVTGAAVGGIIGLGAGAISPAVGAGIEKAAGLAKAPISAVRGFVNPDSEAARRVASAIERDRRIGAEGLTNAEFTAAKAEGAPVAAIDLGGQTTRSLARSAANTSQEGRAALEKLTGDRFATQGDRVSEALAGAVKTPANAGATREALQEAAEKSRKPLYDAAYAKGAGGIWDDELYQLVNSSTVLKPVLEDAKRSIETKMLTGRASEPLSTNGTPTLEFWDQVKRSLDSKVSVAQRAGDRELVADLTAIKQKLVAKLDAAVPEYTVARGVAASFFKATDALDAGAKFAGASERTFKVSDAAKALGKMTPAERDLFAEGFASSLRDRLAALPDNRDVVKQIAASPLARQKIELVLGKAGLDKIDASLRVERIMDFARNAVQGNSSTARQLIEAGMAGGAYGALTGGDFSTYASGAAALRLGAKTIAGRIDKQVAQKVAELLTSDDVKAVQRGIEMVVAKPSLMRGLRAVDDRLGRLAGQQSSGVPALQSLGIGRAENNEPNVPGPGAQ